MNELEITNQTDGIIETTKKNSIILNNNQNVRYDHPNKYTQLRRGNHREYKILSDVNKKVNQ